MTAWSYLQHVFQLSVCYVVGRTSLPPVCVVNGQVKNMVDVNFDKV
jgi:hypothetical protein